MIIVKLIGGLGNQMFQYATGRALAYSLDLPLKLDISFFSNSSNRKFMLHNFNISAQYATLEEIKRVKMRNYPLPIQKLISTFRKIKKENTLYIKEGNRSLDVNQLKGYDIIYLNGYWQSEKYFRHIESIIQSEFTLKSKTDLINQQYLEDILSSNSVSIHIRRGDYISNPKANQKYILCTLDYYQKAIDFISERVDNPKFYIFSDDLQWAISNLQIQYPAFFILHNIQKEYEDLRLMVSCKHHIIANSSFSWWGAWLGNYSEKITIAPYQWFKDPILEKKANDIVVPSWQRMLL